MRGKRTDKKKLLLILIVGILFGGVFLAAPYVGGWEINLSADKMELDGESFDIAGLKSATRETDADFVTGDPSDGAGIYSKPGITVEHSAAFYVAPRSGIWVEDDVPYLAAT